MEEALYLFRRVLDQHQSVELGVAELKREGFSQLQTIRVLMEALSVSVVEADELVYHSVAWSD